jgi:hypothetical protein
MVEGGKVNLYISIGIDYIFTLYLIAVVNVRDKMSIVSIGIIYEDPIFSSIICASTTEL